MRLTLRDTSYGHGVFAEESIPVGTEIMSFTGEILPFDRFLQSNFTNDEDHIIQVGPASFMAPSGGLDDFVNHCCEPNCWLRVRSETDVTLLALREINAGEELSFDYSLTSFRDPFPWSMPCSCGSGSCRKIISNFELQPTNWQQQMLSLGVVPQYISRMLRYPAS